MADLQFHLLDTVARDICADEETPHLHTRHYETPPDSDEDRPKRAIKRYSADDKRAFVIQLFGSTGDGKPVQVDVVEFRPTFYLALPIIKTLAAIDAIRAYLTFQGIPLSQLTLKQIQRKKFYGFTAHKPFPFLELTMPSLALFRLIKNLFLNDKSEPCTKRPLGPPYKKGETPEVYEANLDPMLRFFHTQNISPCGHVQIRGGMELVNESTETITLSVPYTDVEPFVKQETAPFVLVSWDIECYSQTGDFPVASKQWSKIAEVLEQRKGADESYQEAIERLILTGVMGQFRPKKTLADLSRKLKGKAFQETQSDAIVPMIQGLKDILTIGDPVIQIGATVTSNTSDVGLERHLFVWPSCEAIEGIVVHAYEDESDMIEAWFQWLLTVNPDILIGYNVFGFDERYLWDRAEDLGLTGPNGSIHSLTRLEEGEVKLEEKRLSSSAMGDNFLYIWTLQGRLQIDLYHYIKRNEQLPSYKLDEVTKHYLSGKVAKAEKGSDGRLVLTLAGAIKDLRIGRALCLLEATGESLTEKMVILAVEGAVVTVNWPLAETGEVLEEDQLGDAIKWVVVKDDVSPADIFRLHRGTPKDRALVGKYCLQDCDLVLELYRNREVFNNSMSMANVCSVPIGYIFTRGQGIKAESLMFKACRERDTLIPVLPAPNQNGSEDSYEGAIVFDPIPKFYHEHPIGVADFASLYPSSMESENISHDSLVWTKDYDASGSLIGVVFGSDEYDEQPGYGYTDIKFDLLRVNPEDKRKHPEKHKAGLRICRYAQPLDGSKATVPEIIRGLLAARKAKRKEKAKETDPAKQALLEAEQLAYKLTANSLYGQLGSSTFKVRLQSLAASITAYGRNQIMFAKEVIDRFYGPSANDPRVSVKCEAKVMYGDSVTGDTPLLLQKNGVGVLLRRIDELEGLWVPYHETKEAMVLAPPVTVWTDKGWTALRRVIRHRLAPTKKLFRILTHTGVADVTEDHSLVLANGSEVKPSEVAVGTELLHNDQAFTHCDSSDSDILLGEAFVMGLFVADGSSDVYQCPSGTKASWAINKADHALLEEAGHLCPFPTKILDTLASSGVYKLVPVGSIAEPARKYRQLFYNIHREKRIPDAILNAPLTIVEAFWNGFYAGDGDKDEKGFVRIDQKGKEITTGLGLLAMRLGYKVSLMDRLGKQDVFRITMTKGKQRQNPIAIKKIRELPHPGPAAYVYDLETENHHFAVGPGSLIVHNTDSLFIEFALKDTSLSPRDKRQAVIDLTGEAGKLVTKALAPPHDFEFDKIFDPMLMFSKKRYAGLMFEENADDFVVKYMGIALKRRDNAPIVKTVYGTAMKKLLFERDVVGATQYVQESVMDLINGKVKLGQLTITKSLRAEYANPLQIAHKALADRMALRDPGNAPGSGDRIPFVYVQPPVGKTAAKLQGERVEAPSWIKEKGLKPDYEFYLTNQIQNPVSQMFGLVLEEMPGSDAIPWSKAPEDPEKLLVWRESAAAQILFDKALQACQGHHKAAFVTKFFGPVTTEVASIKPTAPLSVSKAQAMNKSNHISNKPKQTTLNSFMLDGFLMKTIEKKERAKRAAKKVAVTAVTTVPIQSLKNEIINQ